MTFCAILLAWTVKNWSNINYCPRRAVIYLKRQGCLWRQVMIWKPNSLSKISTFLTENFVWKLLHSTVPMKKVKFAVLSENHCAEKFFIYLFDMFSQPSPRLALDSAPISATFKAKPELQTPESKEKFYYLFSCKVLRFPGCFSYY